MSSSSAAICHNCKVKFDETNIGLLECNFHPLPFISHNNYRGIATTRFGPNHFVCCGASTDRYDALHFEGDSTPKGCYKIDHCTSEGFKQITKTDKPYLVAPLSTINNLPVISNEYKKERGSSSNTIHIFETEDSFKKAGKILILQLPLGKNLSLNLLDLQQDVFNQSKAKLDEIVKNFEEKHSLNSKTASKNEKLRLLQELLHGNGDDDGENNNTKESEEHNKAYNLIMDLQQDIDNKLFIPFAVIQRVSNQVDQYKIRELNQNEMCTFQRIWRNSNQ